MSQQAFAFDESAALELHRGGLPCAFGEFGLGWLGPHHCHLCLLETVKGVREFWEGVRAGKWDERGYKPSERRARKVAA